MSKRFLITMAAALLALSGVGTLVEAPVAKAATVTLPDMQLKVPTDAISIGTTNGGAPAPLHAHHLGRGDRAL